MTEPPAAAPPFPDDVDVAVVSHNGRETLPRVLDCLRASGCPADRIALYDIGSTDDTVAWLGRDWPAVKVRLIAGNAGPNPARNRGVRESAKPYLLMLDSDAYIRADVPARLRAAMDPGQGVGAVAPVVAQANDPSRIQYSGGALHFICEAVNPWRDRPVVDRGTERRDIGAAPGVALLVHAETARAIGWDDRYFMGKDDGDFCHRLRIAGFRLVEEPAAVVEHPTRPRSTWLFMYQVRNRWHFMLKNYELRTLVVLAPALAIHELLQFGLFAVKGHLGDWWTALKGVWSWRPALAADRKRVRDSRRVSDRALLTADPLVVRADLVGGGLSRLLKRAYDGWLAGYWRLARLLLS